MQDLYLPALLVIAALAIVFSDFVHDLRKDNAALRRLNAFYRSQPVRRCMRFAASKGYDPYNSHTVQARCFKLQAGARS